MSTNIVKLLLLLILQQTVKGSTVNDFLTVKDFLTVNSCAVNDLFNPVSHCFENKKQQFLDLNNRFLVFKEIENSAQLSFKNLRLSSSHQKKILKPFILSRMDLCSVLNIPPYGNISGKFGMVWRFLPMADPFVDFMVSRDLDSRYNKSFMY